jgi:site-specific recombinase XerD
MTLSNKSASITNLTPMKDLSSIIKQSHAVRKARHLNYFAEKAAQYIEIGTGLSANTERSYKSSWNRFTEWCSKYDLATLPSDMTTLIGFVISLVESNKKIATIELHVFAIKKAHQLANSPSPTDDKQFKTFMNGIKRVEGVPQRRAPAFTIEHFKQVIQDIDTSRPEGIRDRAALLLGFTGAFRRQELIDIDIEHLQIDDKGIVKPTKREGMRRGQCFLHRTLDTAQYTL